MNEPSQTDARPSLREALRGIRASSLLALVFAVAALAAASYLYADNLAAANACASISIKGHNGGRGMRVAEKVDGPWYGRGMPPLSDQITSVTSNLFPGASGEMVAYVKNVGRHPGTTSIAIADVTDSGGVYTEPEREMQPHRDEGDLSSNTILTVTYASSLNPSDRRVVASGTLRKLAARGRSFSAPIPLKPHSACGSEVGIWRIALSVPTSADNRIQGDTTSCEVVFGLARKK